MNDNLYNIPLIALMSYETSVTTQVEQSCLSRQEWKVQYDFPVDQLAHT
jgi:hypothetical protein